MWKNYLKIALRTLKRQPGYTFINVAGLAVGMAACLLIILYMQEELSYDDFHENADRIVAISNDSRQSLSTPYPLATALEDDVPEVEEAVRTNGPGPMRLSSDGETFYEIESLFAETDFFEVFSFQLLSGNPQRVLSAPSSIVLTRPVAQRLFGSEDVAGETLYWHLQQRDTTIALQVAGVASDPPHSTVLPFEALVSVATMGPDPSNWGAFGYRTHALLRSPEDIEAMPRHLSLLVEQHYNEEHRFQGANYAFSAVPLTALHLSPLTADNGFTGQWRYLYLFGSIALVILLIACLNYVNLATARAGKRAREVGVRKTVGASRVQLARQFLGESLLLTLGALALAIGLTEATLPAFNNLFGTHLDLVYGENMLFLAALLGLVGVVGLAAGSYPALYLSRFKPSRVLKEETKSRGKGAFLRKGLVVVQFALSAVLLISTFVIYHQLDYVQTKDHGFDKERMLVVQLPDDTWGLGDSPTGRAWHLREALRRDVLAHPAVTEATTVANGTPGKRMFRFSAQADKMSPEADTVQDRSFEYASAVVDYDFIETMGMSLVAGRDFSRKHPSDEERAFIINEATARALGWTPEEAVGKPLNVRNVTGEVIGVIRNFHLESLHEKIAPVVLHLYEPKWWAAGTGRLIARLAPGALPEGINHIREQLAHYEPEEAFEYSFLDETFEAMYRTERRLAHILTSCVLLALFVACLGLFGLATFMAERRTKEIGIRKALGASVTSIVGLLSKDFVKLVAAAYVVAVPVAYYLMQQWLQDFAYRLELGFGLFASVGLLALTIALATVSYQALRAALTNPVDALRYE